MNGWWWALIIGGPVATGAFLLVWGLCRASAMSEQFNNLTAENDGDYLA